MLDLLIRNANLADGRSGVDIAISDGRFDAIAPGHGCAGATRTIDAGRAAS